MNNLLLRRYEKEHYTILFNQKTGFFARIEDYGGSEPLYSVHGPELLDISITKYCARNCHFCYRNASQSGAFMSLESYEYILNQAQNCGVLQIAIGGGNPTQHPDFSEILKITREKYNIVPSYTTNGDGLTNDILKASKVYCGAVAISYYEPYDLFYSNLQKLIGAGIKTNIHFLLSSQTIDSAIETLFDTSSKLDGINVLIFLLYKPTGRGNTSEILRKSFDVDRFFSLVNDSKLKIGFDSCCVPGIVNHLDYNAFSIEACEAGCFSAFISEDLQLYPCSFMENIVDGINLKKISLIDAWQKNPLFCNMRIKDARRICANCHHFSVCRGGCNIFREINLCRKSGI